MVIAGVSIYSTDAGGNVCGAAAPFGGHVLAAAVGADVIVDAVVVVPTSLFPVGGRDGQTLLLSVLEGVKQRVVSPPGPGLHCDTSAHGNKEEGEC